MLLPEQARTAKESPRMSSNPSVTIIINTDGRASSLATTLESLRHLHYDNFEVVVVYGPTPDGTKELLENWKHCVKVGHCPNRNLSESRNISLAMAAGEIVAFLDDDSIPEPEWLNKVTRPFADPVVAASGGYLLDHTGVSYQWKLGTANRFGSADESWTRPAPELNYPFTANYPHVMANSAFRLKALLEIGGFDEQYVYFLDETDAICRLVDAGWHIIQLQGAPVHHKFLASHLRNDARIITSWYAIIRSKIYFSLVNAQGHHGVTAAIEAAQQFAGNLRRGLEWHISEGRADPSLLERFSSEYDEAMRSGLAAGLANQRVYYDPEKLASFRSPFLKFPILQPVEMRRQCLVLLSRWYPPGPIGGIGRYVYQLARSLAAQGHQVHVLTEADRDTVDFEEGVWVHRHRSKRHPRSRRALELGVPQHIWDYSATMLDAARTIAVERPVDAVFAPIWDCEGAAFLFDGSYRLFTSLHTSLAFYLKTHAHLQHDATYMEEFARPMLVLERVILAESDGIVANSEAIIAQIEAEYDIVLNRDRLALVAHGQEDWTTLPAITPNPVHEGVVRLLFVGRLEERKGIDILLEALDLVLPERPELWVDIVGNDRLARADGLTFRAAWEKLHGTKPYASRINFHGEVDDDALRGFYRAADVFVAPSRFESFGLIFLEAMMFGCALIGCEVGGVPEVVRHDQTGLLVPPDDAVALAGAIARLIDNAPMRVLMGAAARADYEERFAPEKMVHGILSFIQQQDAALSRDERLSA